MAAKRGGIRLERWLVCDESQLVLDECPERLGDKLDLLLDPLCGAVLLVEARAEPGVELVARLALEPSGEGIGEDPGLRRPRLRSERFEFLRQVIGKIKLMARLVRLHRA